MTGLVVDASVVIKWVVEEQGSREAGHLIGRFDLAAPDLLMSECANILWKKVRRAELTSEEATLAAELLQRAGIELAPTRALMPEALRLAIELDHPAYDCMYLALAVERGDRFVTADATLVRIVGQRAVSELSATIVPLSNVLDLGT